MKKQLKNIPKFKSEQDEIEFWENHDITDYYEKVDAQKVLFPNLKPSTETISIRLPSFMLNRIKFLANSKDVPYQSYMKILLSDRLNELLDPKTETQAIHAKGSRA